MNSKFKILQDVMKDNHADGMIILSLTNIIWYTGDESDLACVVVDKKAFHIFVDARDFQKFRELKCDAQVHLYTDINSWITFVKKMNLKNVIFEYDKVNVKDYETYIQPLKIKNLIRLSGDVLRMIKTPEELKIMQKAADIACACIEHLRKWVKLGVTEAETAQEANTFMISQGATGMSFATIVAFGKNASKPHSVPSNYKLHSGEVILVDCGCIYQSYCSDITRIWWIGKVDPRIEEMYRVALAANKLGIEKAKSGIFSRDLDALVRNYVIKNYHGRDIPHGVGHGIGVNAHELPRFNKISNQKLAAGNVVTVEPGIYDEAIGGVRVEDTIVITSNGCKVLTNKSPK